jgi:hypothetical protein
MLNDLRNLRRREDRLELGDEIARFVGAIGKSEEREREEYERDQRQEREVRDHRRQMRATVGEELLDRYAHATEYRWLPSQHTRRHTSSSPRC